MATAGSARCSAHRTVPVLCLAGNHDLPDHMRAALGSAPFEVPGHRQFGRWLVVMLDSWVPTAPAARSAAHSSRSCATCCAPSQPARAALPAPSADRDAQRLARPGGPDGCRRIHGASIRQHSNVRGVLWGHVHQSLDSFVHGVRFMATPATCAQFLPGSADFAIDNRPPGYRVLELMPDGAIADRSLLARELRAERRRVRPSRQIA